MGYTHYLRRPQVIRPYIWAQICKDTHKVFDYISETLGITLADCMGRGVPVINEHEIYFNGGAQPLGPWTTSEAITAVPWPAEGAGLNTPNPDPAANKVAGIAFGGHYVKQRIAPTNGRPYGDGVYECAGTPRVMDEPYLEPDADGLYFDCCKTAFRPYDIAVTCFYIIIKNHVPECKVSSDGTESEWVDAMFICHNVLGYALESPLN